MSTKTDLEEQARGRHCAVLFTAKVAREFAGWEARARAGLTAVIRLLAEHGPGDLNPTQFKSEERFTPKGGHSGILIYAIKEFKVRLYGGFTAGREGRRFICSECDGSKKQNKADREKMQRAADKLLPYMGG